jgi:hypothetical protein
MSEWVAVCADETEEPVEIPTENDGEGVFLDKSCTEQLEVPFYWKTLDQESIYRS